MSKLKSESEFEKQLAKLCRKRGCIYWKLVSPSNAGVPDRLIFAPNGFPLLIEAKSPKKKTAGPSKLQAYRIKQLTSRRVRAGCTNDYETAKRWIEELCSLPSPTDWQAPSGGL